MKLALFAALALVLCTKGYAQRKNEYVVPGSVDCSSSGIYFLLAENNATSELWEETQFNIDLYTGSGYQLVQAADFNKTSGAVTLAYSGYTVNAQTAFGPNERPILYNIEQPFYAVPRPETGSRRNYTFGVYCTIPASYKVNITTNTTDDGHGGHGGDVIDPRDHIRAQISGLKVDNSTVLGDRLTYTITAFDNTYASLIPVSCQYYNPNNALQTVPIVSDSCPRIFPVDPDAYFYTMTRIDDKTYEVTFKAFSFETSVTSMLGIDCDVLLCITANADACYRPCWGGVPPTTLSTVSVATTTAGTEGTTTTAPTTETETTTSPGTESTVSEASTASEATTESPATTASEETTATETTTSESTSTGTSTEATTAEVTTESTTEPTTSEATTTEPTTTGPTTSEPTTTGATTTVPTTTEPTTTGPTTTGPTTAPPPAEPIRREKRFVKLDMSVNSGATGFRAGNEPTSTTLIEKTVFAVHQAAGPDGPCPQKVCDDTELLTALYGVIGGLGVLIFILVLTLVYLLVAGRRRKMYQDQIQMIPNGPSTY